MKNSQSLPASLVLCGTMLESFVITPRKAQNLAVRQLGLNQILEVDLNQELGEL